MVGSSLLRYLDKEGYRNIIRKGHDELDLIDQVQTNNFFCEEMPEYVFLAAGKVGGIHANNKYRGQFIYENLMIQNNVIHSCHLIGTKKLLFLGSACIYPKFSKQPITEGELLSGALEKTNEPYAIAKIAGIKLCESYFQQYQDNFISLMPNNLYGPNDNFDLKTSHVIPALIRKVFEAKKSKQTEVSVWGTGAPLREFIHVSDLVDAMVFAMKKINSNDLYENGVSHINVSSGNEISIKDLAFLIKEISGYQGRISFNDSMPDGTPRKMLDGSMLNKFGWQSKIELREGLKNLYSWYAENQNNF